MWSIIKKIIKYIYILSLIVSFNFVLFFISEELSSQYRHTGFVFILLYANTVLLVQLFSFIPKKWLSKIQNKIENYLQKCQTKQYKNKEKTTKNTIQFNSQIYNQPTITVQSIKKLRLFLFRIFIWIIICITPFLIMYMLSIIDYMTPRDPEADRFKYVTFPCLNIILLTFSTTLCILNLLKWRWYAFFLILALIQNPIKYVKADATETIPLGAKPIIYLYPTKATEVSVKVGNPKNLTHTYPKYETGWTVSAEPNSNLTDTKTNKHYYALYWEGKNTIEPNLKEGFIVKGENTIPFLEEKLSQLGLNEREANEFIIYWLPKLESNPYNFIRFQTIEEQNQNMPLDITPKPDTLIRVMMEFKNLVTPIVVKEQILPPTPVRTGFVAVEWGGTDVTNSILK